MEQPCGTRFGWGVVYFFARLACLSRSSNVKLQFNRTVAVQRERIRGYMNYRKMINPVLLGIMLAQAAAAQPTNNLWTRVLMVESGFGRGTIFSLDVDQREYWITAKHILNGREHPPYGSITSKSVQLKILNPSPQGEQWLPVDFSVIDAGEDIDIVVLAPPHILLANPLPSVAPSANGVMLGGDCEFLGFPYGGGWRGKFANGASVWMPYVKHCSISAFWAEEKKIWILDGINNAGFSGGPVAYLTGPQQQVFAVVSGYLTEPTDVITSPAEKLAPPKPPPPPRHKGSQAKGGSSSVKETVNLNSGFIIAFDIQYAIDAIHKSPIGPLRNVQ